MDFAEQLRLLQAAQGDPAMLALATVDLAYPSVSEAERVAIKEGLAAAAIPHWCDERVLAALLELSKSESSTLLDYLRNLNVIETFPARGKSAVNVHKEARLEIRKRMTSHDQAKFRSLCTRAAAYFANNRAPAALIEWIYHLLCANPVFNSNELEKLDRAWAISMEPGSHEVLMAIDDFGDAKQKQALQDSKFRQANTSADMRKPKFDVFLCHNSIDKATVRELATKLQKRRLSVWFDEWCLRPGIAWQETLEEIIETTKAAAVLVGDRIGPWQDKELRGCLSEMVNRNLPVIPVLLPKAGTKPPLPFFLTHVTWVDMRHGVTEEGLNLLQWGITGEKPSQLITEYLECD